MPGSGQLAERPFSARACGGLQFLAGLDVQLVRERLNSLGVRRSRLAGSARCQQGVDEPPPQLLVVRVLGEAAAQQYCGAAGVAMLQAEVQQGVHEPAVLRVEPRDRAFPGRGDREVVQRVAAPQAVRLGQHQHRLALVTGVAQVAALGDQGLEHARVELVDAYLDAVSGRGGVDRRGQPGLLQDTAQGPDVGADVRRRRARRSALPEGVGDQFGGDEPVRVQQQRGEQLARLAGPQRLSVDVSEAQRSENLVPQTVHIAALSTIDPPHGGIPLGLPGRFRQRDVCRDVRRMYLGPAKWTTVPGGGQARE